MVATPIGNLGDVTLRALDVLRRAHAIAAEDTRVTRTLLSHYGIARKTTALHAHNEAKSAEAIAQRIAQGDAVALVTDAGTPGVSDPGARVVQRVRESGASIFPIPGASALTAALSASGLEFPGVTFAGFLPREGKERRERLEQLAAGPWAIALFEAPHRVRETLDDLYQALGERHVVIARELTKRFETIARVALAEASAWIGADADRQRGEFVLLIEAGTPGSSSKADPRAMLAMLLEELPLKQAVALAARLTGGKRNALYALALELKKNGGHD